MTDTKPIKVNATLAPEATWQTIRVVLLFVFGWACSYFIQSEVVLAAFLAALGALLTYGYGLLKLARDFCDRRTLAGHVPDSVAKVKS